MKRIALLMLIAIVNVAQSSINAKGIDKMFVQRNAGNECVFFIFSQKLPACANTQKQVKRIDYDYTYAQRTDSVAMLMTIEADRPLRNAIGTISTEKSAYSVPLELIFVKAKGNKMQYRMRLMMPFNEFEQMYASLSPFILTIDFDNTDRQENFCFTYDLKKWNSNRAKMNEIIELIRLNTGK